MAGDSLSPIGYRHKPRWVFVIAFLFMLAPVGNFVSTLAMMRIADWWTPRVWIHWAQWISPGAWGIMTMLFLSGLGLLFVNRLSWIFASICLLTVLGFNLFYVFHFGTVSTLGPITLGVMVLATLLSGLFLYSQRFRRPYLNPRLRWWETRPRYRADLGVRMPPFSERCVLLDISESGALVDFPERVPMIPDQVQIEVTAELKLDCDVVRRPDSGRAFGLSFLKLSRPQRAELRRFLDQIASDPTRFYR
jgi:hypothetical protein